MGGAAQLPARYVAIDAVRGFAVLGILLMNIVGMGMPGYAYVDPGYFGGGEGADLAAWAVNYILVDGKMRALFAMLFGASMLLIAQRADETSLGASQTHYRRMAWLLLFGLIHGWLFWYGDILHCYAVAGLVVFLRRDRRPRLQVGLGIGALVLPASLGVYEQIHLDWLRSAARAPGASAEAVEAWRTASAQLAPPLDRAQIELNGYRGTFLDALAVRVPIVSMAQTYFLLRYGLLEALGYMLIGMALFRLGFITGQWASRAYFRFALAAYLVCVPLYLPIVDRLIDSSFDPVTIIATDVLVPPLQALMALRMLRW